MCPRLAAHYGSALVSVLALICPFALTLKAITFPYDLGQWASSSFLVTAIVLVLPHLRSFLDCMQRA